MADNVFTSGTGRPQAAVSIADPMRPAAACALLVNNAPFTDELWLLSVSGSGSVNLQVDVNFSNALFVTVFGDKLTNLTFRGLAVPTACADTGTGNSIIGFFSKYKAGAKATIDVIAVAYNKGDFVFKGILTDMNLNPYDQAGLDAFTFDMTILGRVASNAAAPSSTATGTSTGTSTSGGGASAGVSAGLSGLGGAGGSSKISGGGLGGWSDMKSGPGARSNAPSAPPPSNWARALLQKAAGRALAGFQRKQDATGRARIPW